MPQSLSEYLTTEGKLTMQAATGIADYTQYMCDYECDLRVRQLHGLNSDKVAVKALIDTIFDELNA